MPTEHFAVADSQDATWNAGSAGARYAANFDGSTQHNICTAVKAALIGGGWSDQGGTKASFSLVLPYGLPITTVADPVVEDKPDATGGHNPINIDGLKLTFYDSYRYAPVAAVDRVWVAMGLTVASSMEHLKDAIVAQGWTHVTNWQQTNLPYSGWWHMDFEAPTAGLDYNDESAFGGPHEVSGSSGSGWYPGQIWPLGSFNANGTGPAGGGAYLRCTRGGEWLQLWIGIPETAPQNVALRFSTSTEGAQPQKQLSVRADVEWRIVANQFQFALWADPTGVDNSRQLLVSVPWTNPDHGPAFAALISTSFRSALLWGSNSASAADGELTRLRTVYDLKAGGPGLAWIYTSFAAELLDALAHPILQNAWLALPAAIDAEARIVGRLWDALLSSKLYARGARMRLGDVAYECVGQHAQTNASRASLWLAVPDEE